MSEDTLSAEGLHQVVPDLERKRVLLKTINDFALKLLGIPTRSELVWYVAREVVGRLGFVDCVVYLVDPDRNLLRQVAAIGVKNPHGNQIVNALEIPIGDGITGHVARTSRSMIVEDLADDSRYIPDVEKARSEICVPLIIDTDVVGVIDCEDPRPGTFDQEHLELLTTIAAMTSAKLKMIDETRRVAERTEELRCLNDQLREEILERKRAEADLRENRDQLRLITDNLPILIVYIDKDERFRFVNKTCADWYARPAEDILGQRVGVLHGAGYAKMRGRIAQVLSGTPTTFEENLSYPDGVERQVRIVFIPHLGAVGRIEGFFAFAQDVTDLRLSEDRLRQAQKMEAVGQLTGGVAHDFNNLLAVILGNAELLADETGSHDEFTQAILRSSARGAELTQRLLAFSRQQALRPQSMDLAEMIEDMSELLRRTLGETIEIETIVAPDLGPAWADPGQVENAILNLAINSRDAMRRGGKLTIECMNARLDEAYVATHPDAFAGDYVVLAVSDSGVGMSAEVREHAFEPFFTTKAVGQGSGLGLSMVYGFAKQSKGHVNIYSEEGQGTTVKLYLPRAEDIARAGKATAKAELPSGRGERILVIEDDADVRALAVKTLEALGYRVTDVVEAASARTLLERGDRFDLILSDVVLPGGMSGPEFAEEARARYPDLKVVLMSGYPAEAARRNGFMGSERVLLNKPFQRRQLAVTLREALDR